jgi:hypothetical protein
LSITPPRDSPFGLCLPRHPNRLELIPGTETKAHTVDWGKGNSFNLKAPILNFTIQEVLDPDFRTQVAEVLKFWIDYDMENLFRIKSGIHRFRVPFDYETNTTRFTAWTGQGGRFRDESLLLAQSRLEELMGLIATHYYNKKDMVNAAIYAMALRQLSPKGYPKPFDPNDVHLHMELNRLFGMDPPSYVFQACDSLLKVVKDELARHGITDSLSGSPEAE